MSRRIPLSAAVVMACTVAAAPLVAQQDTAMVQQDTAMMQHDPGMMQKDTGMMQQDTGMMKHDSAMMDHGKMMDKEKMMDHGKMMGHDSAMGMGMGENMMFMGAPGQKAAGDYAVVEKEGKHQLTLTDDFSVAAGQDLYLVLANGETPDKSAIYLGKLKQPTGGQTYDLPKGKDLSGYSTLLVWSKKDKKAVASAEWHMNSGGMMHKQ